MMTTMATVLHILDDAAWRQAQRRGAVAPPSLAAEGFVHASTAAQLLDTVNRWYPGRRDLWVLAVDVAALGDALRWEAPARPGRAADEPLGPGPYPHVYAAIELAAVVGHARLVPDDDGVFRVAPALPA